MGSSLRLNSSKMPSTGASHNSARSSRCLPQHPPPTSHLSQPGTAHNFPGYERLPSCHPPVIKPSQRSMQRMPYRLSEGRTATASPCNLSAGSPVRMTIRQPLNIIPLEYYEVYPNMQSPENGINEPGQSSYDRVAENGPSQPLRVETGGSQGNQSAPLPLIRPRLSRPQAVSNKGTASDPGLLTFRMEPDGQSAVVVRHSESLFQPGQLVGYQAELASCFGSKMCPICQEEWIWKIFTPAEMALLDSSGAEWEIARLPCGHVFHGACLAVWFHEICAVNPPLMPNFTDFGLHGSPSCPCCRRQYRFREYRWSGAFCYEGWRLRYNWPGDREESSPDAYLNGRPHYPSISRRVSFTIRSQSEEQPRTPYISDSGQRPLSQPRRRHPSWTTLSSSGGGTILRRTRRTSRYVSDTLNALEESPMVALPEEQVDIFTTGLEVRDLQALTPNMILYEPEYWNRYELEVGEEGEGGTTGYEQALSNEAPFGNGGGWPHLEAYITPEARSTAFSPLGDVESEVETSSTATEQGEEARNTDAFEAENQLREEIPGGHDSNVALNELLCRWNTQSTIGDVLRDFHWIIAYVLEGMQQYEAGMAPWPRVPQNLDQRMRNLNVEDAEGNISITSASRRVLSLLESTGIPQAHSGHRNITLGVSKIPRLVKKESRVETTPENQTTHSQEDTDQRHELGETESCLSLIGPEKALTSVGKMNIILSEQSDNMANLHAHLPRTSSWPATMKYNERANASRSPDKRDLHPRVTDLGNAESKIPTLSPRPGRGNLPNNKTEIVKRNLTPKSGGSSPMRGRRGKLMAGEIQVPTELHFSRGRKITRDKSPLTGKVGLMPTLVQTKLDDVTYLEKDEDEQSVLVETTEKTKDNGLDKENRRPEA